MIFRGISVSAVLLILQACGILFPDEPPPSTTIQGKVSANETRSPIPGIKVSIEETGYLGYTDADGAFKFEKVPINGDYKIKLEDVDGDANGGLFKEKTLTLKKGDYDGTNAFSTNPFILIDMDLDTE